MKLIAVLILITSGFIFLRHPAPVVVKEKTVLPMGQATLRPVLAQKPQAPVVAVKPPERRRPQLKLKPINDAYPIMAFSHTVLQREDVLPWLEKGGVKSIYFRDKSGLHVIKPATDQGAEATRSLFITTNESVQTVITQREKSFSRSEGVQADTKKKKRIAANAYDFFRFIPGLRDDGITTIVQNKNLRAAVHGPDFDDRRTDMENLEAIRAPVVSLGHGGEITLKVRKGYITDGPGADFVIYENTFRLLTDETMLYQEFGYVGVASEDKPNKYKWFTCGPMEDVLLGCAGVVPTNEGGDKFDLAQLGVDKIRFIKIRDSGLSFNIGENTEGFDLDAIQLLNGYRD